MQQGIFASKEAAAGANSDIRIPGERSEAVLWLVQRLSKLTNERLRTAQRISDIRKDAKAAGYAAETIAAAQKLGKLSPERRTEYKTRMAKALSLYGMTVDVITEDPKPDLKLVTILDTLKREARDRTEIGKEITDTYKAAKESGIDVPALKQIFKLAKLEPDEREEWFHRLDNIGTILKFW